MFKLSRADHSPEFCDRFLFSAFGCGKRMGRRHGQNRKAEKKEKE